MNLLFILGNGFDINLGLKTGYQDFYDYYKSVNSDDADILAMKESIESGRYSTWSDLESGLGEYTAFVDSPDVFVKCLWDIKDSLNRFLSEQFERKTYLRDHKKIYNDLSYPERYLDAQVLQKYEGLFHRRLASYVSQRMISVVTFNYTNTLEDIFSYTTIPFDLLHVHGRIDGLIMGVNDENQIYNESLRSDRHFKEEFVKPDYNSACFNNHNSLFEGMISTADVIILFGTSLGATDRRWWERIGQRMIESENLSIIYFPYDSRKDTFLHPNYRLRWTTEYLNILLRVLTIPEDKEALVLDRLFVGINKDIFKLPQEQPQTTL